MLENNIYIKISTEILLVEDIEMFCVWVVS